MTDLFSKETITLDDLREQLRRNDFTTMPVADKRKYSPDELEVHNLISGLMDEKWQENAKAMGQKHPSSCYSGDFPKIDHDRKWNHSRSKIKTVSYEGLNREIANDAMRVEEQAIANADYESFLESCSDMDR